MESDAVLFERTKERAKQMEKEGDELRVRGHLLNALLSVLVVDFVADFVGVVVVVLFVEGEAGGPKWHQWRVEEIKFKFHTKTNKRTNNK